MLVTGAFTTMSKKRQGLFEVFVFPLYEYASLMLSRYTLLPSGTNEKLTSFAKKFSD